MDAIGSFGMLVNASTVVCLINSKINSFSDLCLQCIPSSFVLYYSCILILMQTLHLMHFIVSVLCSYNTTCIFHYFHGIDCSLAMFHLDI
jgi:hypothetical protein